MPTIRISKTTPKPTLNLACQKPTPEGFTITYNDFGITDLEKCQASLDLKSSQYQITIPIEVGLLTYQTSVFSLMVWDLFLQLYLA
jgi:hypothetical protein